MCDGRELVGSRVGHLDERPQDLRRERQDEHAAENRAQFVEPVAQPRQDTEVAAAASQRPEQIAVPLTVHVQGVSAGGDEFHREQVVDRESVLSNEPADPSAQREPGDTNRMGVAEPGCQPMTRGLHGVLPGGESGLRPGASANRVDVQPTHVAEVEHEPAVGGAMTGVTVGAASNRQFKVVLARERNRERDIR
jgi:hypothetical protein